MICVCLAFVSMSAGVCRYDVVYDTKTAAFLMRPYLYSNLRERLSSRPFLGNAEKVHLVIGSSVRISTMLSFSTAFSATLFYTTLLATLFIPTLLFSDLTFSDYFIPCFSLPALFSLLFCCFIFPHSFGPLPCLSPILFCPTPFSLLAVSLLDSS